MRFGRAPDAADLPLREAEDMESSSKHVIATLSVCAGIVAVTVWAILAVAPVA